MNIDTILNLQIWYAILTSTCVGAIAGYIGSFMVTKRMALMGGALGHLTLPGIALAIAYGFDVSLGALVILIGGVFIIWLLEKKTKLPTESLTAIVFATSLAIALLFLKHEEIDIALIGDISKITLLITAGTVMLSIAIFFVMRKILPSMVLSSISEELAEVEGIPVSMYKFIYLTCIALVVALGVRIVGGLMTAALVAIPAATSKNVSKNLAQYTFLSLLLGATSCGLGVVVAHVAQLPAGPIIILCSSTLFFISLFIKKS